MILLHSECVSYPFVSTEATIKLLISYTAFRKNRSLHKKLLKFLKLELGDIVFYSANKKLNDLTLKTVKDAGKSLIVAYNEHSVSKGNTFFEFTYNL